MCFFSPFGIAITSFGEESHNLNDYCMFVRIVCLILSGFSSSGYLRRAAVCDCCTPWTLLLPLFFFSPGRLCIQSNIYITLETIYCLCSQLYVKAVRIIHACLYQCLFHCIAYVLAL